jgi:mono/diheme cytochrome c family protein
MTSGVLHLATVTLWHVVGPLTIALLLATSAALRAQTHAAPIARPAPAERITYLHVAPIFAERCVKCHADNGLKGAAPEGYRLTSYEAALTTTDRARIVPGAPNASELMRRIRGQARPRMPADGSPSLTDVEIKLIEDWITQGARNAEGVAAPFPVGATVRLHGILKAGGLLDGLPLIVGPRTRVDKIPAPSSYVAVDGKLDEKRRVIVERLRPE